MIQQPVSAVHERPSGDPVQLRADAHRLGSMGEQLRQVMRPYPVALQTASLHMPMLRLPHFALLGHGVLGRRQRLLNSLGRMSGALLDYARALERAQHAVDAANRHPVTGPPATPPVAPLPPEGGIHTDHLRVTGPSGELLGSDRRASHLRVTETSGQLLGGDHRASHLRVTGEPLPGPIGSPEPTAAAQDAEAALGELRRARLRCLRVMHDVERDWPPALRTGPIRLPVFQPIGGPPRWTGPPRTLPVERIDPRAPIVPMAQAAGSGQVVDGRVRACRFPASALPVSRLAGAVPA